MNSETLWTENAAGYERRLRWPIVSLYIQNKDRHVKNFLSCCKGDLLDLGSGSGYYLKGLLRNFENITAVDSSDEMLELFKKNNGKNGNIKLINSDVRKFSSKSKFDSVLCIGLLNYLNEKETESLVSKVNGLMKKGGKILISAPTFDRPSGHLYRLMWGIAGVKINLYGNSSLMKKMKSAGFIKIKVRNSDDLLSFHVILEARK